MNWDRVERLLGAGNLAHLAEQRVGVIGLGSGGGYVALALAMAGVKRFMLMDDKALAAHNVVRHVADLRYVGWNKAEAVADLIRQRSPDAAIITIDGRVQDHMDTLDQLDLVIVGVDNEPSKYAINEACLDRGLAAVYAGVYERGEGGDVVIIRANEGPCYACWAQELRDGLMLAQSADGGGLDYGMIGQDGTLEAEPGLWIHVARVAGAQADVALNELLRATDMHRPLPGNTVILANVEMEIVEGETSLPQSAIWATVARDPQCLVCGARSALHDEAQAPLSLDDLTAAAGIDLSEQNEQEDGNR